MRFINLVEKNGESPYLTKVFNYLNQFYDDDTVLIARVWNQECNVGECKNFISIITSAEGHRLIPHEAERLHPRCLGVFMHYYPKQVEKVEDQFNPDGFLNIQNVYPLQLGPHNFAGNSDKPILERQYNVSFIGQLDPHVRSDLYYTMCNTSIPDSKIIFYEGWNKGLGREEYGKIMSDTKIALVPCGSASHDTFRFYEACEAGCAILTLKQNNYEFMQGSPHIEIPSWGDVSKYIDYLLNRPEKLAELSEKTKSFWNNNLCPEAAAKFMLKKLGVKYE